MAAVRYASEELSKTTTTEDGRIRLQNMSRIPYSDIFQHRVMYGTP